ncbi:MAG: glycosyl hydrolase family 18 protein [Eubacteriales bacterium]|nr:glycosyl hydrolase family 18 protein [Eubacteriales bacterium]
MKRFTAALLTFAAIFTLLGGTGAAICFYIKYAPSGKMADQSEWFGASGDEAAIIWNQEQEHIEAKGRLIGGEIYLPLTWVQEHINEKFYWDAGSRQLIYTLPESIVYAGEDTLGSGGQPLVVEQEGEIWLLTGLIQTYTDVRIETFADGAVNRVFVDDRWEPEQVAKIKKDTKVRVRGGVKSSILTEAAAGDEVVVLETMENWSEVRTGDGYIGYVENKRLGESQEKTLISTFAEPEYTSIALGEPVSLVWHQVTSQQANKAMKELMANTKGVNVIAPTWFMLTDNEGGYASLASQDYVDQAHAMGLQVWAVVDNFNQGTGVQSEVLFADMNARKKLIASLMEEVKKYDIDGINLDIESIKPSAGPHYVQFIRELSVDCRKNGIVLSVDNYVPSAYSAFYDRAAQAQVVDYVIIMGYDEHYAGGEAGSVASLDYVKNGIRDTLEEVPKEKLVNGIPFYTRVWKADGSSTAMGIAKAKSWVEENGVELYWQEELGQYYGEATTADGFCQIWMEEEDSIARKMELIREYDLAGVACWKLGFEPENIWDIVNP